MTTPSSQVLLTFLINACWQVALVVGLASLSSWLLRNSTARYRHWVWVSALLLSIGIPAITSLQLLSSSASPGRGALPSSINSNGIEPLVAFNGTTRGLGELSQTSDAFLLSRTAGWVFIGVYLLILLYSSFRLLKAWFATRRLKLSTLPLNDWSPVNRIVESCSEAIGVDAGDVSLCASAAVDVPFTVGAVRPLIILPQQLLGEADDEVLKSAVGHELIHIKRRDYAFNLIYELLYLPLSFHPAAALIRRRIRQTRELSCDEMVAERILNAEVYARSLVQLASSAPTLRRLSVTTTVGIADADILEARVMSLLKKSKLDTRRKRAFLIAVSLLLLVPCLAAASFAMKFDVAATGSQSQESQEKERREKERAEEMRARVGDSEIQNRKRMESDPQFREEVIAKEQLEVKLRALRQAALVKAARITMDQAIQIATSQKAGKVLECTLEGEHWKEPGVLAADSEVFYRVILVGNDDAESGAVTHFWVNAIDGSIIKTETERMRKQRPE